MYGRILLIDKFMNRQIKFIYAALVITIIAGAVAFKLIWHNNFVELNNYANASSSNGKDL